MRLLILTQKVDKNDDLLGFFHRWIEEFSKNYESVIVVCLEKGEYTLPQNVSVYSLGKEEGVSKWTYIKRFYTYIWRFRRDYDTVFVHMNQEYVLLGGIMWRLLNKRLLLWRNHPKGTWLTCVAVFLSNKVFVTSPFSYTAKWKRKGIQMPAGVDVKNNISSSERSNRQNELSVLSLGRVSPVKRVDVIVEALNILYKKGVIFTAGIYGDPPESDAKYYKQIRESATALEKEGKLIFWSGVPYNQTQSVYSEYEIFVNATLSGSFDKTILEAMAYGLLPLVSNKSFVGILPPAFLFEENNANDLANKLTAIVLLSDEEKKEYGRKFREYVVANHSIDALMRKIQDFNV